MKTWTTEIMAIDAVNPERGIVLYGGPNIKALTKSMAQEYCNNNGLGYCKVSDQLMSEIPCKPGTYEPDMDNQVDYDTHDDN